MAVNDQWTSSSIKLVYASGGNDTQTTQPLKSTKSQKSQTKIKNKQIVYWHLQ